MSILLIRKTISTISSIRPLFKSAITTFKNNLFALAVTGPLLFKLLNNPGNSGNRGNS
jgi:hypothetical protein